LNKKNGVENMKKFICSLLLAAIFCHITAYASSPAAWAIADVENAIVAGYVPKEIQSEYTLPVKRSEFCHMAINFLCHELGLTFEELADKANSLFSAVEFSDVTDKHVILASKCGIVYGYEDGSFLPDKSITREEAAAMLARLYKLYGSIYVYSNINYRDNNLISQWAVSDVKFCVAKGIMKGVSDTHFQPEGTYTREQAIVTFNRLDNDTDWENHNKTAPIRRKLTKEIAEKEIFANGTVSLIEKFETPYGTVFYTLTGGMMQSPGYGLFLMDESGQTYSFTDVVPSEKVYRCVPEIKNISFYPEKTHFSFEVSFNDNFSAEGVEIHKAGTYYFEANLVQKKTLLTGFVPKDNKLLLEQGIKKYTQESGVTEIIEKIDTGAYGVLLYVKTDGGFADDSDDRYCLALIGNDGKSHLLPSGPVISRYGQLPPILNITLSEYNSVVSYERIYTQDDISSSPELKKSGKYICTVNLITLESKEEFIEDDASTTVK